MRENGELPIWTIKRLELALKLCHNEYIITASAGTTHKPPPIDKKGFPVFESRAAADYLIKKGINPKKILTETSSYDTIGNAYFTKVIHVDPIGFKNILVINSKFHMPRTKLIFTWVYNLKPQKQKINLYFEEAPDQNIHNKLLESRIIKEQESINKLHNIIPKTTTLKDFHKWLFENHNAYNNRIINSNLNMNVLESY